MATRVKRAGARSRKTVVASTPAPIPSVPAEASNKNFPIVGVGASAGGLGSFLELIGSLPESPGLAIVFILHQEKHESALAEVVSRISRMPVETVAHGATIQSDRIYIAPADRDVLVARSRFIVQEPRPRHDHGMPIDTFLSALAEDQGSRSVAVLLSGSGSDGTQGAKAVKAEGGITFAQDDSAQFQPLPEAAIAAGAIDFVLPPEAIAHELILVARHANILGVSGRLPETELLNVFTLLHSAHDVDFSHYKPTTIERRIRRRMALHKVDDLRNYVTLLADDPQEIEGLYADILIRVTGFFRDPEVFDALGRHVLPLLLKQPSPETPLRLWVPGCATGEEVYSLAIVILEAIHELGSPCSLQIFGTDVSDAAVDRARLGVYPESIAADVTAERLRRYFTKVEGGAYRVSKAVRDCCVFARQNLTKDPPFSRLDLISCRNVMIYLGASLQRRVMSIFHYALRPNGYLLLGSSETIGHFADLFATVDRKHKIYQKKATASRPKVDFEAVAAAPRERVERVRMEEEAVNPTNVFREADRLMLQRFSPPGVLINENMDILQFRGRTSLFLEPPAGAASFNILKMAREGLLAELRAAIHSARKREEPVRREGVRVKSNGGSTTVNIEVVPFVTPGKERYQIILFEEVPPPAEKKAGKTRRAGKAEEDPETRQVARLKRELEATREYLQSIIEEQEAMNEELRSANEEIQSSNEELQSTNEELETAKEELQSSNEELTTLNEELENRNQELAEANNDLINLLTSVDLPIVMLDSQLRIRRFNPGAQRAFNLIASDVGRSITDLKLTLMLDDLDTMIAGVIDNLEVKELEVQDRRGQWYSLRIRPYKTLENKIEGAVLVLIDLEQLKKKR